ncbi:hypothetical protein PAPHI01_2482 [Pancytospora philotis]|nr:hypothetical protein PAPHI01_2482 [Pancytospora philotis]
MLPVALYRLLPFIIIAGVAAMAKKRTVLPASTEISYPDISPFRGELRGYRQVASVLRRLYQRSVYHSEESAGSLKQYCDIKRSTKCKNMLYWVVINMFQQDDPVDFVRKFVGNTRLAECRMLALILDKLKPAELATAHKELVPAMAMNCAEIEKLQASVCTKLTEVRDALDEIIKAARTQSPEDFFADYHPDRTSSDVFAYLSLRCERDACLLRDELPLILNALCARAEAISSTENADSLSWNAHGQILVYGTKEGNTLIKFIHRLLSLQFEAAPNNPVILQLALSWMTSQYNRCFIELLTAHKFEGGTMAEVTKYICVSNAKDVDSRFVCEFFATLRKMRRITQEQEVDYLIRYYCNSSPNESNFLSATMTI